jgi:energy-coupling factor transporter ATP-binding protein EcfA2
MLISFSVSNYRSFGEEQVVSLVANGRHKDHPDHLRAIPGTDEHLLPVMALYGANAAGKSNLLRALSDLQWAVCYQRAPTLPTFMHKGGDCTMEVQFLAGGRVLIYGLQWSKGGIAQEWLVERQKERRTPVFERVTGADGEAQVLLGDAAGHPSDRLKALAMVGARKDHPFLRVLRDNLNLGARGEAINLAITWLDALIVVFPSTHIEFGRAQLSTHTNLRSLVGEFLREAGTGVAELTLEEREIQQGELEKFGVGISIANRVGPGEPFVYHLPRQYASIVLHQNNGRLHQNLVTVRALHPHAEGQITLPIEEESDGTQRMIELLPLLLQSSVPSVVLIDEIDRSLHPQLSKHLVRQFLKLPGLRQLIFTTHDLNFLDTDLLRRDEIWFAEKKEGATELYSLADFKVRKDLSIDKAYLQGRFGAVPPVEVEWPEWVQAIRKELEPRKAE